ncbi:MAG: hypothetical protein ACFCVH_11810 [Alphaproteobacteria bacterium]
MARLSTATISSLAALAVCSGVALAEAPRFNVATDAPHDEGVIAAMQGLAMAQQLASRGVETGDPILLIAAARLASQVDVSESTVRTRDEMVDAAGDSPALHTAAEMLTAARALSGGRDDLLGLIEDAEAESARGSIYGSGYYEGYISGGDNLYYDEAFFGGEQAVITLQGHNPSDIDLWIYDEFGNLICSSTGYSSYETCSFTPRWTGNFTIRVENEGHPQGTYFTLWTN